DDAFQEMFSAFKDFADKKHDVYDEDLIHLFAGQKREDENKIRLLGFHSKSGLSDKAEVTVTLQAFGKQQKNTATGNGPIEAAFKAVEGILNTNAQLEFFTIQGIHGGIDAQGTVKLRLSKEKATAHGHG